jgi:hypothetical protein
MLVLVKGNWSKGGLSMIKNKYANFANITILWPSLQFEPSKSLQHVNISEFSSGCQYEALFLIEWFFNLFEYVKNQKINKISFVVPSGLWNNNNIKVLIGQSYLRAFRTKYPLTICFCSENLKFVF